jgi:hypothetical protein
LSVPIADGGIGPFRPSEGACPWSSVDNCTQKYYRPLVVAWLVKFVN